MMDTQFKEIKEVVVPPRLKDGDGIRIIAPASAPDMRALSRSVTKLTKLGYRVSLGRNIRKLVQRNSLAAPSQDRAEEIMEAFRDDTVNAIFCARGGYGSIHILPYLDYDMIREHPKIFMGYSDITALHMAFNKLSGMVTFHGPMPASDPDEYGKSTFRNYLNVLSGKSDDISQFIDNVVKYIFKGKVEGKSVGTNVSVFSSLIGTDYMPSSDNRILFAEDTGITSGDLDRYFSVMKLSGILQRFVAFAFGDFKQIVDIEEPMPYIEDIIQQYLSELQKPSVYGLPFGHVADSQMLIPLNAWMTFSTDYPYIEVRGHLVD